MNTLDTGTARERLRAMSRIRRFEEKSAELYSAGKIRGFLHLYVGEEAIATGVMAALSPDDAVVSTYREHGHALARGVPMGSVMAEMFGKVEGCSRGRGGSMHLFDVARRFYGGNAIVAGGLPLAAGLALALAGCGADPADLDDAIMAMIEHPGPVIFDCLVEKHENCFPMIPSGKPHNEMLLGDAATEGAIQGVGAALV